MLEDNEGGLWLTSNRGIARVSRNDLDTYVPSYAVPAVSYGTGDGLKSLACSGAVQPSAWKGADGRLWFATYHGVAGDRGQHQAASRVGLIQVATGRGIHRVPVAGRGGRGRQAQPDQRRGRHQGQRQPRGPAPRINSHPT